MGIFDKFRRRSTEERVDLPDDAELQDLYKSAKRSRRVHIALGLVAAGLVGFLIAGMLSFGGVFAAFGPMWYAINGTLAFSAIGCAVGSAVAWVVNRKNRLKVRLLEESRKRDERTNKRGQPLDAKAINKNEAKFAKDLAKAEKKKVLTEKEFEYLKNRIHDGVDRTDESVKDWRNKETLTLAESLKILETFDYTDEQKQKIKNEYNTTEKNAKIEYVKFIGTDGNTYGSVDVAAADNDVCYDMIRYDLMNLVNKTQGIARVVIKHTVDGTPLLARKTVIEGTDTFNKDDMNAIKTSIASRKAPVPLP